VTKPNNRINKATRKNKNNVTPTPKKEKKTIPKCVEWAFNTEENGRTTVSDWNLVCSKSHLKAVSQNAFILGTGCSVFTGILSDKYGRRAALMTMIFLMVVVLNVTQVLLHLNSLTNMQKYTLYTISRFLQGVAQTMYSIR
jgi:MFS family permease